MSREAMQQALEALERGETKLRYAAITALRAALAEPAEPVAWMRAHPDGRLDRLSVVAYEDEAEEMLQRSIAGCTLVPLYTSAPTPRKPEQEPVACQYAKDVAMPEYRCVGKCQYAHTPRKPMPLKDVERLIYEETKINPNVADDRELLGYIVNAVRAIEAAHGIGDSK